MIPASFPCSPGSFKAFKSHIAISIMGQPARRPSAISTLNTRMIQLKDAPVLPYANTYLLAENSSTTLWQGCAHFNTLFCSKTEGFRKSPDSAHPKRPHTLKQIPFLFAPQAILSGRPGRKQPFSSSWVNTSFDFPLWFLVPDGPLLFPECLTREFPWLNIHCFESGQTHTGMSEGPRIPLARDGNVNVSKQKEKKKVSALIKAISSSFKNILTLKI